MAELKTKPTDVNVEHFLAAVPDERKRQDARVLLTLMQELTGEAPRMWGPSIVGFGSYHYVYESGREGDWMRTGFSPRKTALTLYLMGGVGRYAELLSQLGKHKTGKSCLYIKRLSDVDMDILRQLIAQSLADLDAGDIDYGPC